MNSSKRITVALLAASLWSYSTIHGQTSTRFSVKIQQEGKDPAGNTEKRLFINNIPGKTLRHFHKNFEVNGSESWEIIDNGYLAKSFDGKVKQRVFYRKNGQWQCTINDYHGTSIPREITSIIRHSRFEDYEVTHVSQIQFQNSLAAIVSIYNGRLFKNLRIVEGEIEILGEYVDLDRKEDSVPLVRHKK